MLSYLCSVLYLMNEWILTQRALFRSIFRSGYIILYLINISNRKLLPFVGLVVLVCSSMLEKSFSAIHVFISMVVVADMVATQALSAYFLNFA